MQVSSKIDHLIQKLNELKPSLSNNAEIDAEQFKEILKETLEISDNENPSSESIASLVEQKKRDLTPYWVDPNYGYDPQNPRKPNMLELTKAISGKSSEELRLAPDKNWEKINRSASQILYGVVGSNKDTRDWSSIMAAEDILAVAQIETGKMYEPKVDVESILNDDGEIIDQIAILKDKNENTLQVLPEDISSAEEILQNYGATRASVPDDLDEKIVSHIFDDTFLNFLKTFDQNLPELEKLALQTTTEHISKRLIDEIPMHELEKL